MKSDSYIQPVQQALAKALKDTFNEVFRSIYDEGDPVYIPEQNLPSLIIDKQDTTPVGDAPTGAERFDHHFTIQAEFDKRKDFNANPTQVTVKKRLVNLVEGIDPETGEIGDSSLLGVIRRNYTLGGLVSLQTVSVDYGLFPRGKDVLTQVAVIDITLRETRVITNRS